MCIRSSTVFSSTDQISTNTIHLNVLLRMLDLFQISFLLNWKTRVVALGTSPLSPSPSAPGGRGAGGCILDRIRQELRTRTKSPIN